MLQTATAAGISGPIYETFLTLSLRSVKRLLELTLHTSEALNLATDAPILI